MSAKDNFAQAMKELLNAGDGEGVTETEESKAPGSFSSFSQPENRPPKAPAPEKKESIFAGGPLHGEEEGEKAEEETSAAAFEGAAEEEPVVAEVSVEEVLVDISAVEPEVSAPRPDPAPAPFMAPAARNTDLPVADMPASVATVGDVEVTVLAAGTTLVGDIITAGDLKVGGDVKGNLKVANMLELNGKIIGDIEAENVKIMNSLVRGNVKVEKSFSMDGSTTVVGDVSAKDAQVDGKIKGNLTVEDRGHFQSHATLVGNLIAGTVIIDEGAMLKGDIAITNAQNENISVEEPEFDIEI